jgi:hypothetical protein
MLFFLHLFLFSLHYDCTVTYWIIDMLNKEVKFVKVFHDYEIYRCDTTADRTRSATGVGV